MEQALIKQFLDQHSIECEPLSQKVTWELQQKWREHFAAAVKEATGKWILNGSDWHAFSSGHTPSLSGFRAEVEYANLDAGAFVVISANEHVLSYQCETHALPDLQMFYSFIDRNPEVLDLYLFATDFRWTVVFTHEPQHSIYLARSADLLNGR
ncbi:MAG TPA: hypothetical protein VLB46_16975 [Pyrinomonadaceae bacterium]|nr:hypothetical protein [Pyrinomonadaceae bacterium]